MTAREDESVGVSVIGGGRVMQRSARDGQGGFSLIELTVAMAVTLIVTGAVYGLLAGGQSAFRREPELTDRQQNIRVAMDLILRDIANAGSGMPSFMQTFTPGLDACATCPMGPDGVTTDELELVTNPGSVDNEAVCASVVAPPGAPTGNSALSDSLLLMAGASTIAPNTPVVLIMTDGTWTVRNVVGVSTVNYGGAPAYTNCGAAPPPPNPPVGGVGTAHVQLDLSPTGDTSGMNVANTLCTPSANGFGNVAGPCDVIEIAFGELVRYRIRPDADGVPVLQRSTTANAGAGFQTLARGIEDLQVQYMVAPPGSPWVDGAPVVVNGAWPTIISQVQVTLSARSEAQNIEGATTSLSGPDAIRGRLTATASPRSSLLALSWQPNPPPPAAPVALWR
jgi:prepilin-type N-terminal cleavage/methylation domain-containing protein